MRIVLNYPNHNGTFIHNRRQWRSESSFYTWFFMQPLTFNWSEVIYSMVFCFCFVYMCTYVVDIYEDTFVCGYACMYMRLHVQARRQPQMFLRHCPCFSFETGFLIGLELACRLSWLVSNPHLNLPQYLDYSCMLHHLAFITFYFFLLLFKCRLWEGLCVVGCWLVGFQVLGMDPRALCLLLRYTSLPFFLPLASYISIFIPTRSHY